MRDNRSPVGNFNALGSNTVLYYFMCGSYAASLQNVVGSSQVDCIISYLK
jgi:hypothetical protein